MLMGRQNGATPEPPQSVTDGEIIVHADNGAPADSIMVAVRTEGKGVEFVAMSHSTAYELGRALMEAASDARGAKQTLRAIELRDNQSPRCKLVSGEKGT
jgi:hypothetical protein